MSSDSDRRPSTRVALVTGGSNGIGAAVVRALAARGGWHIVVADIDAAAGAAVAAEVGGLFVQTDVADPAASVAAVEAAEKTYGRLDFAHLNAGIAAEEGAVDGIDLATYRRITGINLDGVFFGMQAAVPALRRAGGGSIVATASLAGLVPTPLTPIYALTKHAVVGLVRSVAVALQADGIRVSAVAPGFAETAIIGPMKAAFDAAGFPLLSAEEVADVVLLAAEGETGAVYPVQKGRPAEPYRFRGVPGPRVAGKEGIAPPTEGAPAADVPATDNPETATPTDEASADPQGIR
jgi:NAD(P)-dependent dehydrogenase (short-subunit alcohol dehydrogenase family)